MNLLVAAAECSPLARTGGLGEAVAGLSTAVAGGGHDVSVVLPRYRHLLDEPGEAETIGGHSVYRMRVGPLQVLLLDDPPVFDREGIYGPRPGEAYDDQWWRWTRFCAAVRDIAAAGRYDLLHLHDGHTGPAALVSPIPTVFTVHNAAYSLLGPLQATADLLGLPTSATVIGGPLEWYGQANFTKAGLVGATRANTVSPTFADELTADPAISGGLDGVIAALPRPLVGIMNGINSEAFDPATDRAIAAPFGAGDIDRRRNPRVTCRGALRKWAGLDEGVIFGNVGRMSEQKGLGLLDPIIDDLVAEGFRLVAVGNGELDDLVDEWAVRHPAAVHHVAYDEETARRVFAGCDAYLMPSRFEPSGLGQLYAMRYGAPPVVRLTGGLADSVVDVDEDPRNGTGFGFRSFTAASLAKTIRRAIRYRTGFPELWRELQRRGMRADWSWRRAAADYLTLYREALDVARGG